MCATISTSPDAASVATTVTRPAASNFGVSARDSSRSWAWAWAWAWVCDADTAFFQDSLRSRATAADSSLFALRERVPRNEGPPHPPRLRRVDLSPVGRGEESQSARL